MIQFLVDYGAFLAKTITILAAILVVMAYAFANAGRKQQPKGYIEITDLSEEYDDVEDCMVEAVLDKADAKAYHKAKKQKTKQEKKQKKSKKTSTKKQQAEIDEHQEKRVFVVHFNGDVEASQTSALREELTAILTFAKPTDEVLVVLESSGGYVHSYGHAASQLKRITDAKIKLTVAVDEIAASGGYLMACVANKIIAAPFAIIGSVGVIGQLPNFNKLLKKYDIDYEMHTAGKFKRTLTVLGENTDTAREKFIEELEETHLLFKKFISENRKVLNVDKIATGEHWYGLDALNLKLIDEVITSDAYLLAKRDDSKMYQVEYVEKESLKEKLAGIVGTSITRVIKLIKEQTRDNHIG